jgi:aspartyl-tRNA(Asn)/glutamyl-tRNA(Gln) amidotransferase subunit A
MAGELCDLTLSEASQLIRTREASSVQLVEAVLERAGATEPKVHAYVRLLDHDALEEAHRADDELAKGRWLGPLHGIPVAVKDLFATAGVPTEAGSKILSGWLPTEDATAVRLLRNHGAVIVGKTWTHEFAYGQNTPPTRNAWDTECYPGGSSAGSGVAVAVRSAFASLGTDSGGSVRVPACLNGGVGLKPTFGLLSRRGVVPLSASLDHVGLITRTVEDAAHVLSSLAVSDEADPASLRGTGFSAEADADGIGGLRLGVDEPYFLSAVDEEVLEAFRRVLDELEDQGATIVPVSMPELACATTAGLTILLVEASGWHSRFRGRRGEYEPGTRLMLELGELVPGTAYVAAQRARRVLRDALRRAFDEHALDSLIAPSLPLPTVPLDRLSVRLAGGGESALSRYVHHAIVANLSGQPALTIPCGFTASGLPIGVEFLGRPLDESTLIRLGRAYEPLHKWHEAVPPTVNGDGARDHTPTGNTREER